MLSGKPFILSSQNKKPLLKWIRSKEYNQLTICATRKNGYDAKSAENVLTNWRSLKQFIRIPIAYKED